MEIMGSRTAMEQPFSLLPEMRMILEKSKLAETSS